MHWGDGSTSAVNRKAAVPPQLSTFTLVDIGGTLNIYNDDHRLLNWTDGTPLSASANNQAGVYIGTNNGFSFTAPADTVGRTLIVHVGGYNSAGTLTAHLSDNSAPDFTDTTAIVIGSYDRNYTLTYVSASAGQTLTVTWKMIAATGGGNVTLSAAAMAGGGGSIVASAGTPQSAPINTAFATALKATVKDSGGNPIGGLTVTFAVPGSGASGTFGGSITATAVTNGSGVATAPALTANGQTGGFSVTATVAGLTASYSLTNTAALGFGSLQGTGDSSTAPVDLTAEGTVDWIHWGENDPLAPPIRKAGVTPQLTTITQIGTGQGPLFYGNDPRPISWTDGTPPVPTSTNNKIGFYIHGELHQQGFFFTAPADQASRILTVHVGGFNSGGTLTAHLSDGSAPDYVDITPNTNNPWDRNYTLTYNAAQSGQTLKVSWVMSSGTIDNVTIAPPRCGGGTEPSLQPGALHRPQP